MLYCRAFVQDLFEYLPNVLSVWNEIMERERIIFQMIYSIDKIEILMTIYNLDSRDKNDIPINIERNYRERKKKNCVAFRAKNKKNNEFSVTQLYK